MAKQTHGRVVRLWRIELSEIPANIAKNKLKNAKGTLNRWLLRSGYAPKTERDGNKWHEVLAAKQQYATYFPETMTDSYKVGMIREDGTEGALETWYHRTVADTASDPKHPFMIGKEERALLASQMGLPAELRPKGG